MEFLVWIVVGGGIGLVLVSLIMFIDLKSCEFPVLKFKSFIAFYDIDPNKWDIQNDYVIYQVGFAKSYAFRFSFLDTFRYKIWKRKKDKKAKVKRINNLEIEAKEALIEGVKKSIKYSEISKND